MPFLRLLEAFHDLEISDYDLCNIIYGIELKKYDAGEVLFKKGDVGEHFFILIAGEVDVYLPNPDYK